MPGFDRRPHRISKFFLYPFFILCLWFICLTFFERIDCASSVKIRIFGTYLELGSRPDFCHCLTWTRIAHVRRVSLAMEDEDSEGSFRRAVSDMADMDLLDEAAQQFDQFFANDQIIEFVKSYRAACVRRKVKGKPKSFSVTLMGTAEYGFGVCFTMALNIYLIAQEPHVDRSFEIMEFPSRSVYSPLSSLFQDFAAGSPCPLYANLDHFPAVHRGRLMECQSFAINLDRNTGNFTVSGCDQAVYKYPIFGSQWKDFRDTVNALVARDGVQQVFATQSLFTRALWSPNDFLKKLLRILWKKVRANDGGYFALHIRRTDKITWNEMKDIPMERYLEELDMRCRLSNDTCRRRVFVMYDDQAAYQRLKALSGGRFTFLDLTDLLADFEMHRVRGHLLGGLRGGDVISCQRHTRELIVSLTLMAMADHVVCTYSSNLCRIVALIKGDRTAIHSLDMPWFPIF